MSSTSVGQALIVGGWGTEEEIAELKSDERRTLLIAEMENMSSYSVLELENFPNYGTKSLIGLAHISVLLKTKGIRMQNQLTLMDYDGLRNTLIVELSKNMFCFDIYKTTKLKTLGDISLYNKAIRLRGKAYFKKQQAFISSK